MGQLDKRTTQQDVASLLEEFGPIESINVSVYSLFKCDGQMWLMSFYEMKDLRPKLQFAQVYRCD